MPRNHEDPEFMKKWKEQEGRWGRDPEAQLEAARKGGRASAKKQKELAAAKRKLADKREYILEAAAAATVENPEWMENMIKMFMQIINDEKADTRDRMNAADKLTEILGTRAPKTSEVAVKTEQTAEEIENELKELGVDVHGFKVIEGGQ